MFVEEAEMLYANKKAFLGEMGSRVRTLRVAIGLSQEELANKIGYTTNNARSSIHKIESGKADIPISKIQSLAYALRTTPSYIMGWTDSSSERKLSVQEVTLLEMFGKLDIIGQAQLLTYAADLLKTKNLPV